jgi:hypothetical protein
MFYTIYKITNRIDGKIYIGCHKTEDPNDEYMGSGKYLINAQKKYGIENFEKDILEVFDNPEAMFEMESTVVNEDFVNRTDTYNLKEGGCGGFGFINNNGLNNSNNNNLKANEAAKKKYNNATGNEEWLINLKKKSSETFKEAHRLGKIRYDTFTGKKHTEEAKMKIGESSSKHQVGTGNSQYDTMWIYSLEEKRSQKIKKDDLAEWESKGWLKGRKMKF